MAPRCARARKRGPSRRSRAQARMPPRGARGRKDAWSLAAPFCNPAARGKQPPLAGGRRGSSQPASQPTRGEHVE
eukprot:2485352-Alexandrium_andersonii.AAC.1